MARLNSLCILYRIARRTIRSAGFASLAVAVGASALVASGAAAQELPSLIKIVVPFPPGGSNDVAARAVAQQLAPRIGKNVIVENRPGASGFIGATAVARAPRDGSTLLLTSSSMVTAAATKQNVPIDILKDLTPVSVLSDSTLLFLVSSQSKIQTPADLIAAARANPDTITNGTPGIGTIAHLTGELLSDIAGIKFKHIPYNGGGPALIDLLGGRVDINIVSNSSSAGHVAEGKLRPVALSWNKPSASFPNIPPMATAVPGFDVTQWQAIWAPAGTPQPILDRLNREFNEIVKTPEFGVVLRDDGGIPQALTPAEADAKIRASFEMWSKLAKAKNLIFE